MLGARIGIIAGASKTFPILFDWDASVTTSVQNDNGSSVLVGSPITKWKDNVTNTNDIINSDINNAAVLEEEVRNGLSYRYVRNLRATNGFLITSSGAIKYNRTMFLVFRQNAGDHIGSEIFFNCNINQNKLTHSNDHYGYRNAQKLTDYSTSDYTTRIWAFKYTAGYGTRALIPNGTNIISPVFVTLTGIVNFTNGTIIKMGSTDATLPCSFCWYEILIYDASLPDDDMLDVYNRLIIKWGINSIIQSG